jgi:glycosyltransferase involved in cell wall biosynthesis
VKLSLLMPVYNEAGTIVLVIEKIIESLPDIEKELVIVDDGSTDGTRERLEALFGRAGRENELDRNPPDSVGYGDRCTVRLVFLDANRGKGGALQVALRICTGGVIVIQDADLEYEPADLGGMYDLIVARRVADVVYGSRFYGKPHRSLYFHHYVANRLISLMFNILYNQTLTDIEVCYKMFTRDVLRTLNITCDDFGFEIQISAQIALRAHWRVYEVGIHYFGRTYAEGKKIGWRDGLKALWYLMKFRISPGNSRS